MQDDQDIKAPNDFNSIEKGRQFTKKTEPSDLYVPRSKRSEANHPDNQKISTTTQINLLSNYTSEASNISKSNIPRIYAENQSFSAYERSKMRQFVSSKTQRENGPENLPQTLVRSQMEVTPLKPQELDLDQDHLYRTDAQQKNSNSQRSLRYDPEATPTKNATASKYESTEEKERVLTPPVPRLNLGSSKLAESDLKHSKIRPRIDGKKNSSGQIKDNPATVNPAVSSSGSSEKKKNLGYSKYEDEFSDLPKLDILYKEVSMGSTSFANSKKDLAVSKESNLSNFRLSGQGPRLVDEKFSMPRKSEPERDMARSQNNLANYLSTNEQDLNDSLLKPPSRLEENLKDSISDLKELFGELIELARDLEFCKQELVLQPEYNLGDCHKVVSNNRELNFDRFMNFLDDLGLASSSKEPIFSAIFSDFDLDKDKKLSTSEWEQLLTPIQKEYRILLNCRTEKGLEFTQGVKSVSRLVTTNLQSRYTQKRYLRLSRVYSYCTMI